MIGRRQLAVASPISGLGLARALLDSIRSPQPLQTNARRLVVAKFGARAAALTDSGTSALVLALRLAAPKGGTVGFPGYGCVDLVAAARFAGVNVRLYDIDPVTLSPDLESVRRMIRRGVDAIVVAHLFGYAADVLGVQELALPDGVVVIEDAAQGAGGLLRGKRLGGLGDLSVVSFGRGKGLCAGGGGALLTKTESWERTLADSELGVSRRGWSVLASTAMQWALGRPAVYAIPSALPWLHLGEMVYHPAEEPRAMSIASSSLVASAFDLEVPDLSTRRSHARILDVSAHRATQLGVIAPLSGSSPGYLRYPVRDIGGGRRAHGALGVVRPYPGALGDYPELGTALASGEPPTPGAFELGRTLFTLPTHRFVGASDLAAMEKWMGVPSQSLVDVNTPPAEPASSMSTHSRRHL